MKRFITILAALCLVTYPAVCFPSYLIKLKNGQEFLIPQYWEESGQIMFDYYGGVVRIEKDQVEKIESSDLPYHEVKSPEPEMPPGPAGRIPEAAADKEPGIEETASLPEAPAQKLTGEPAEKTGSGEGKSEEEVDLEFYRNKRSDLKAELDQALESYFGAVSRKDHEGADKAMDEVKVLSKKLFDLQNELSAKTNGELPDWWKKL